MASRIRFQTMLFQYIFVDRAVDDCVELRGLDGAVKLSLVLSSHGTVPQHFEVLSLQSYTRCCTRF